MTPGQTNMPRAGIMHNYEGIWKMTSLDSAQKNSESSDLQIAKSKFVTLIDPIAEKIM